MTQTMAKAHRAHAVETLAGRLRYLSASSADASNRQDRQAINSVIQGSAADLLKCAMILLWGKLEALGCDIILQIHDELIIDCKDDESTKQRAIALLKEIMCVQAKRRLIELHALNHKDDSSVVDVPLEESIQIGKNLGMQE